MKSLAEDKRKYFVNLAFFVLLIGATFYFLLRGCPLAVLLPYLSHLHYGYIALGLTMMLLYLGCEAVNIRLMVHSLGGQTLLPACFKYSLIGFYFSAITPGASGGQPAQVYYMQKEGIPVGTSTLGFVVILAVYQVVTLLLATIFLMYKGAAVLALSGGIKYLIAFGFAANLLMLGLLILVVFSQKTLRRVVAFALRLLHKCHVVKNLAAALQYVDDQLAIYQAGVRQMRANPAVLLKLFAVTAVQLLALFSVPFMVYKALGFSRYGLFEVMALEAILTVAVSSLPLPGAVGAAEASFLRLYRLIYAVPLLTPALLLSRSISFYSWLVISGAVVLAMQVRTVVNLQKHAATEVRKVGRGRLGLTLRRAQAIK